MDESQNEYHVGEMMAVAYLMGRDACTEAEATNTDDTREFMRMYGQHRRTMYRESKSPIDVHTAYLSFRVMSTITRDGRDRTPILECERDTQ